jgi:hypothetical protein
MEQERGTGSVLKLKSKNVNGDRVESRHWYILYYDHTGKQVKENSKSEDRSVAEALLARRRSEVGQTRLSTRAKPMKDGVYLRLNRVELRTLLSPAVYTFYHNSQCLYVGSAASAGRPLGPSHHLRKQLEHADELLIRPCETREEAFQVEAKFISELKPLLNKRREAVNGNSNAGNFENGEQPTQEG